jgi:hypothetical protein
MGQNVSVKIFGEGEFVGDGTTGPLEIVRIETRPGPAGSNPEIVPLIAELRPSPPGHERWWWWKRIAGERRRAIGGAESGTGERILLDAPRNRLEESIREIRRNLAAANEDYPQGYFTDAQAAADTRAASAAHQRHQLEADQAIIDRVMGEEPPRAERD